MNDNVRQIFNMLGIEPNEKFKIKCYDSIFEINSNLEILTIKNEVGIYDNRNQYLLSCILCDSDLIIKLPKKKKLRDLTKQEWDKWQEKNCGDCSKCIFEHVFCDMESGWIHHKDLYSDKFLDQEFEVEE